MSGHTPGPWLLRRFNGKRYVVDSTPDRNGRFIGQLIAVETTSPDTPRNLQLIAAAPDLLAVCRKLFERGAVIATTGLGDELGAAIAKAEGK